MIPDPNLSFSLTEFKNDRFTDIWTSVRARTKRPFPGQWSEMITPAIKLNSFHYIFPTIFVFRYVRFRNKIDFTGDRCVNHFGQISVCRQTTKMKGRASKVSCSSQKVGGNTWRPFWRSVKNAQFHPTKHLSRWVPKIEAERYSTPSIFSAHRHFRFFCSRWPSFLRNDQWGDAKAYLWSVVKKKQKSPRKFIFVPG